MSVQFAHLSVAIPASPLIKSDFEFKRVEGLSTRALEVHLGFYDGYVKETNSLIEQLQDLPRHHPLTPVERLQRDGLVRRYAFEYNGVLMHEYFFEALSGPGSAPAANGIFSEAVDTSYGGFEIWKRDVEEIAQTRGVGWVVTYHSKGDNRITNVWVDDHTRGHLAGLSPVAVFDLWEHAYLLDFKPNQRSEYMRVIFDNMNWNVVETRCA
jgi:superoxide dismutase, Fe-Mn family